MLALSRGQRTVKAAFVSIGVLWIEVLQLSPYIPPLFLNCFYSVLTSPLLKSVVFCNVTPCSPVEVQWLLWETHCLCRSVSQARSERQLELAQGSGLCCLLLALLCLSHNSFLNMETLRSFETTMSCSTARRNITKVSTALCHSCAVIGRVYTIPGSRE
jgi:hypothetical protein